MTKTNKTHCNGSCGACSHVDTTKTAFSNVDGAQSACEKTELGYGFYSNVLQKPFERLDDLKKAEEVYFAEQKAKEDKVAQKKADAQKVEDAFKALNAARKEFKEKLTQLTEEYSEALTELREAYELGKKDIHAALADAETAYAVALREFTEKYENYHMTLKDGDFETTISNHVNTTDTPDAKAIANIFDLLFGAL